MEAYENYNIAQHGKAKKEYFALGEVFHFFQKFIQPHMQLEDKFENHDWFIVKIIKID